MEVLIPSPYFSLSTIPSWPSSAGHILTLIFFCSFSFYLLPFLPSSHYLFPSYSLVSLASFEVLKVLAFTQDCVKKFLNSKQNLKNNNKRKIWLLIRNLSPDCLRLSWFQWWCQERVLKNTCEHMLGNNAVSQIGPEAMFRPLILESS